MDGGAVNPLRRLNAWLNGAPAHRIGIAMLQRAIGACLLFRVATEGPFADYLWGPNAVAVGSTTVLFGDDVGSRLDVVFRSDLAVRALLAGLAVSGLGLLTQVWTRAATLVAWAIFMILGLRLPELNDGGDNFTALALFYLIGVLPAGASAAPGSLRAWLHNLSFLAVAIQTCMVYFVAGFMKLGGSYWQNGTAFYVISQVEWFSIPEARAWFKKPFIVMPATYSTMLFQVWFPIALFSSIKLWFLALAMAFHLGIAINMGLITFSTVMAGADLALISDAEFQTLRRRLRSMFRLQDESICPASH